MQLTLGQQISRLNNHDVSNVTLTCDHVISQGIIKLIQRQPFYGILLAKLNRHATSKLSSPFGLGWINRKVTLEYRPFLFSNQIKTDRELLFWLEHEALHLIWLHPVRYPNVNKITQIATDVAVNQLIPNLIDNAITLEQVNRKWQLKLPPNVNSKVYVTQLKRFFSRLKSRYSKRKRWVNRPIKRPLPGRHDDHHLWNSDPQIDRASKTIQLKRLIKRSYQNTGAKARGTLPGRVHSQLQKLSVPGSINWKAYVKMGLGSVPFGRKPSRARFNRRQAYRMDLMGRVSNYIQPVNVFVDNSGSMSDNEVSYLLAQLGDFLKHFAVNVSVYDFDTQVHIIDSYRANNYHQIKFTRVGGGGTRFQSIFNYCHRHLNANRSQLIMILTDGYGERHLNYYGFNNLLWLLTEPKRRFSVKDVRGRLVSLSNDPFLNRRF